jgi:hypothetical protein
MPHGSDVYPSLNALGKVSIGYGGIALKAFQESISLAEPLPKPGIDTQGLHTTEPTTD